MIRPRLCVVLLLVASLMACRQPGDALGTTIRLDPLGERVSPDEAQPRATTLALPADFPRDVHLPAHYAIDTMTEMPGTRIVNLLAKGEVMRLSQETRSAMEGDGWQRRLASHRGGDSAVLAFEKDGRSALFAFDRNRPAVSSDDAGVVISVQLQDHAARM